jgi:tetratricopeptide (TPR) repeat protein
MQVGSFPWILALSVSLSGCGAAGASRPETPQGRDASRGESAAALFAKGEAAGKRGDSVRAEQYVLLAVQRGFDRRTALPVLLSACVSSMHLRAALDHAESYLLEHPDDEGLRYLVATLRIGLGRRNDARLDLERLLRRNPDNANARFLLGVLYADIDVEGAREHLRLYLAAEPHGRHAEEAQGRLADLASPPSTHLEARPERSTTTSWRARR